MQKGFYHIAHTLGFVPLSWLIRFTGQRIVFPFYHLVSDAPVAHIRHLYPVRSEKQFCKDLDYLLRYFRPLEPVEFITRLISGEKMTGNGFLLSFDDGLREFYDVVAPILRQKGVPAVCFLNTAFIGNNDLFFRYKAGILYDQLQTRPLSGSRLTRLHEYLRGHELYDDNIYRSLFSIRYSERHWLDEVADIMEFDFDTYLKQVRPYLDIEQISSLARQGFLFGSHSIDHPDMAVLPIEEQLRQVWQSTLEISRTYHPAFHLFSFPFTDYGIGSEFFEKLYHAGPVRIDLSFGGAGLKKDRQKGNIQRIPMEIADFQGKEILWGEYAYYMAKALFGKNTVRR